jgi:hypothetical protein
VAICNISSSTSISEGHGKVTAGVNCVIACEFLGALSGFEVIATCYSGVGIICAKDHLTKRTVKFEAEDVSIVGGGTSENTSVCASCVSEVAVVRETVSGKVSMNG